MQYYIYSTYNCNLNCKYCSAHNVVNKSRINNLTVPQIEKIINYLHRDCQTRQHETNSVIFFGGEPSLAINEISIIIDKTSQMNLKYNLYTNGLLLDKFPKDLLKRMDIIFVSIDGNIQTHEKYRGKGTYSKILQNVKYLKTFFPNTLIGRITVEEDVDIYSSVVNLLGSFNSVHWQIVNKPKFDSPELFIANYQNGIRKLFDFWYDNLCQGNILDIIPFKLLLNSLIFQKDYKRLSFPCKVGRDFQVIDIDGNIYECDEFIGNSKKVIGTIDNLEGANLQYKSHVDLFPSCKTCEITDLCLGRCRKCLEEYEKEQILNYCKLARVFVDTVTSRLEEIKKAIEVRNIPQNEISNIPYYNFEEIP